MDDELAGGPVLDQGFARELVDRARAEGVNLVGSGRATWRSDQTGVGNGVRGRDVGASWL
jgi:hypothetical protein